MLVAVAFAAPAHKLLFFALVHHRLVTPYPISRLKCQFAGITQVRPDVAMSVLLVYLECIGGSETLVALVALEALLAGVNEHVAVQDVPVGKPFPTDCTENGFGIDLQNLILIWYLILF